MDNNFYIQTAVFVEIVRQGSITAAAEALGISKSNASQKLADLEQTFDIRLFQRTTRSMTLTTAGRKLYEQCAPAVDAVARAQSEIGAGRSAGTVEGTVTVAGSNIFLTQWVMPLLTPLLSVHPGIRISMTGSDRPLNQREENIDLRFRIGPITGGGNRIFPLKPMERILCASAGFHRDRAFPKTPEDLHSLPAILREQERKTWKFRRKDRIAEIAISRPQVTVNSYELLLQAIRSGMGMAVVAKAVVEDDLAAGKLVRLVPDWHLEDLPVSLLVPHARLRKPAVSATAGYLADALQ